MDSLRTIKLSDEDLPFKLEWLRSFLAVAETGGFTKAAKQLHVSQPAVSTHVKELETSLGTRLFEHVAGRIRLSRSGETAAAEARKLLESSRDFLTAVTESEETVKGVLRLGASTTPGNYILPPVMSRFERQYPQAKAALLIGNSAKVLDRLMANEVDLGMIGLRPADGHFVSRPLCEDEIVVFAPRDHPLARKREVTPADLARERFLVREADSATRRLGDGWFGRRKLHPEVMVLGCPETVKRAVVAGLGLGMLSKHAIEWEVQQRKVVPLRLPGFPLKRTLYVAHLRRKHFSRTMTSFLRLLEAAVTPSGG